MKAFIKYLTYYLPEKILTNDDLIAEFPEWTVEKVASKIGVTERRIAGDGETALDLAYLCGQKLFEENKNIDKLAIDFILLCTQSPDYYLPTSACVLQNKLGLSTSCGALDFNLGCSGYVYGLSLAKGLIAGGIAKNVLLITSETYSKHIHPQDKGNRTIFGDAASATLISTVGFAEIGDFSLGTDGAGAENLIVKTGGFRSSEKASTFDDYLYMNGSEIFNFTLRAVPSLVDHTLLKNHISKENIDLFIFHQANKYMLDFLRKKIKIDTAKFYIYMEKVGNTVSSTIPIAITEAVKEHLFKGNVLLAGFGVGYSWGGVVLKCNHYEE